MNILIGRLILFVNTTLKFDVNYEIAMFVIQRYPFIDDLSIKVLIEECYVSRTSINRFCESFGFHSFVEFQNELMKSKAVKMNQLTVNYSEENKQLYKQHLFQLCSLNQNIFDQLIEKINKISEDIKKSQRIFIFGAIYPLSICIEFQTNMVSIGKKVYVDYHSLENNKMNLNEDDISIILSASGRYLRECSQKFHEIYFSSSKKVLMTLSDQFESFHNIDHYLQLPNTNHVFDYNFYLVCILELIFCNII